jgi:hypothetical protein
MTDIFKQKNDTMSQVQNRNLQSQEAETLKKEINYSRLTSKDCIISYLEVLVAVAISNYDFYNSGKSDLSLIAVTNNNKTKDLIVEVFEDIGLVYELKYDQDFYNHTSSYSMSEFGTNPEYESAKYCFYLKELSFKNSCKESLKESFSKKVSHLQTLLDLPSKRSNKISINQYSSKYFIPYKLEDIVNAGDVVKYVTLCDVNSTEKPTMDMTDFQIKNYNDLFNKPVLTKEELQKRQELKTGIILGGSLFFIVVGCIIFL